MSWNFPAGGGVHGAPSGPTSITRAPLSYVGHPEGQLIGVVAANLVHLDSTSFGAAESPLTETIFDTTTRPDAAHIMLTNNTGDMVTLRSVTIKAIPVYEKAAFVHDAYIDRDDIARRGDVLLPFGGDNVTSAAQLNKIAEHLYKSYAKERAVYTITLPGTWHWLSPGEYYKLEVGGAGKAEYVSSVVTCTGVRTILSRDTVQTLVTLYEVEESFKFDSTAAARFIATGRPDVITATNRIAIGSQYSDAAADIYTDGTADDVEINRAITLLSEVSGGGVVHLGPGIYNTAASIVLKAEITLEGEGEATIIKKNGDFSAITVIGTSGNLVENVTVRNLSVTRDSADANVRSCIVGQYTDNLSIYNCMLYDSMYAGILVADSAGTIIRDNTVYDNDVIDIYVRDLAEGETVTAQILNNKCSGSTYGIYLYVGTECVVSGNSVRDAARGLTIDACENSSVVGNVIETCSVYGLVLANSTGITCISNTSRNNTTAGIVCSNLAHSTVSANIVNNNTATGIGASSGCYRLTISHNVISENGWEGIACTADQSEISNNTIVENTLGGITIYSVDGMVISGNSVCENGIDEEGPVRGGIMIMAGGIGTSTENVTITGNLVKDNITYGIYNGVGDYTVLTGNRSTGHADGNFDDNGTNTTDVGNDWT